MIENGIPADILNTGIGHIKFEGVFGGGAHSGVYSPNDALYVILSAPEVTAFTKAHEIQLMGFNTGIGGGGGGQSRPDLPHISSSLEYVTLGQALDRTLETFPGIWVYQNCPRTKNRERVVYFRFFYLRKLGPEFSSRVSKTNPGDETCISFSHPTAQFRIWIPPCAFQSNALHVKATV